MYISHSLGVTFDRQNFHKFHSFKINHISFPVKVYLTIISSHRIYLYSGPAVEV